MYRRVDFTRSPVESMSEVVRLEWDPNRSAHIALLRQMRKEGELAPLAFLPSQLALMLVAGKQNMHHGVFSEHGSNGPCADASVFAVASKIDVMHAFAAC